MPEDSPETVVNDGGADSTPASTEVATVNPPAESTSVQAETAESNHVPYNRFKEVNERAKASEAKIAELEKRLAGRSDAPGNKEKADMSYAKRLADKGVDAGAAAVFSEVMEDIARDKAEASHAERERASEQKRVSAEKQVADIEKMKGEFKKSHKDYDEMEPLMRKEWEGLDQGAKMAMVASDKSYEVLYNAAKGRRASEIRAEGVEAGRTEAYEGKNLKAALSSVPGTTANPGKKFVPEDLAGMTKEYYLANLDKIKADLGV